MSEFAELLPSLDANVTQERASIGGHLERLAREDPEYHELVISIAAGIPPMEDGCRLSLNIPAHREEDRVYTSLGNMLISPTGQLKQVDNQGRQMPGDFFELVLCNNWGQSKGTDNTEAEARRFMTAYPDAPVRLISLELPDENANVGFARRLLQDVTLLRSYQRMSQRALLYIAIEDADNEGFDPTAVFSYVEHLDAHSDQVGARLHTAMNPITLSKIPHLFMRHRLHRLANIVMRYTPFDAGCPEGEADPCIRFVPASGYGVVYAAKDLVTAGGFRPAIMSEDYDIWKRLFDLEVSRGHDGLQLEMLPPYVITSPRRYLASDIQGHNMYGPGNWQRTNDLVRLPEEELIAQASEKHRADMDLQRMITTRQIGTVSMARMREHISPEAWRSCLGKVMLGLGFSTEDYTYDGTLQIHNWADVEARVQLYTPSQRLQAAMGIAGG